jgi:hypothetical protein
MPRLQPVRGRAAAISDRIGRTIGGTAGARNDTSMPCPELRAVAEIGREEAAVVSDLR